MALLTLGELVSRQSPETKFSKEGNWWLYIIIEVLKKISLPLIPRKSSTK